MTTSKSITYSASSLDDLTNTITITAPISLDADTVYIDSASIDNYTASIRATGSAGDWTISDLNGEYKFNWGAAEEWLDSFPDWQRVQDMCKKYPGLEIAMRNFQTVYTLVKDDYDNPKDES